MSLESKQGVRNKGSLTIGVPAEKWNEAAVAFEIPLSDTVDCQICPKLYECKFEQKSNDKIGCLQMMQMRKDMTKLDEIQEVK